ncbi:hypothetical protein GCM10011575_07240 [Microlunatus endophyticus]|uniref:Uncharacterized protein n=1 Tax=Microlunatus endophyticus TaxID=1716077 RepID=A0A917W1M6_9ACTN|nr:hypothetical protein GCM10011575_07240 [Microlunatus endophyticus]
MLADDLETFVGDPAAARDVAQERHHILRLLRSAEGNQDHRVVRLELRNRTHDQIFTHPTRPAAIRSYTAS